MLPAGTSIAGRDLHPRIQCALQGVHNNICERALKKAILHRKNALFYKTENGAHVGDIFMSLIHTCELYKADAFDYLTQLDIHETDMREHPENWLPWNYCQTITKIAPPPEPIF